MNNKLKRSIALLSVGVMLMYSVENRIVLVHASDNNVNDNEISRELISEGEEYSDFPELREEYKFVDNKVEEEINNSSGEINNDVVEEYLNENGIFDDEIASVYSDDDIEQLELYNEEDLENISVQVGYFAVADVSNEEASQIENDMVKLSDEQVDMYLSEKYYNQDTSLDKELNQELFGEDKFSDDDSICDKFLTEIGIKPITTYAESQTKQGNCMLKKVVTCYKQTDGNYATVIAVAIWDSMPSVRDLDAIGLNFGRSGQYEIDAQNNNNEIEVTHFFNEKLWYGPANKLVLMDNGRVNAKMRKTTNQTIKNNEYNCSDGNIKMAIKLHYSEDKILEDGNRYKSLIEKEGVRCKTHVRLMTLSKKSLTMTLDYLHKTDNYEVVGAIITLAEGNAIKAIFVLANDNQHKSNYAVSGVKDYFEFNFK